MKKLQLFLLQGLLSSVPLYTLTAQTTTPSTHYAVETGIVAGHGDYSPFWFTANRQGLSSVKTENGYLRAGIFHSQALDPVLPGQSPLLIQKRFIKLQGLRYGM